STVKATVKASGAKQTKQATSASDKDDVVKLPQTGNAEEETAVLAGVGSLMMGLAMALGFKKKRI
ncbi:MAG: LPXTG cell wall anchor domain-containing protein, partial [Limosilactobacillus fermentum]|nr:LPXTG cell wall anchor domain-containing protein [Limosilactobacillus fermentum]